MAKFQLPVPTRINGRLFFERFQIENCKRELIGLPPLARDPTTPIEFVPASRISEEFGRSRRTIGRRIAAAERAAAAETRESDDAAA